jgi:hypothetical protein
MVDLGLVGVLAGEDFVGEIERALSDINISNRTYGLDLSYCGLVRARNICFVKDNKLFIYPLCVLVSLFCLVESLLLVFWCDLHPLGPVCCPTP